MRRAARAVRRGDVVGDVSRVAVAPELRGGVRHPPDRRPGSPSPVALARVAAPRPPASPGDVALLIERPPPAPHFRGIVNFVAPADLARIWRARRPGCGREAARVAALLDLLRADWFAVIEREHPAYYTYADVTVGIPLARHGWDDEDLYSLHDFRPGFVALFALAWSAPGASVDRVPVHGIPRAQLRAHLGSGPFAGLADFADWIARETGLEHLDTCHEEGVATAWTRPNLARLRDEWPRASALLDRVGALVDWLEGDEKELPRHFEALLTAALGGTTAVAPDQFPDTAAPAPQGDGEDPADRAPGRAE